MPGVESVQNVRSPVFLNADDNTQINYLIIRCCFREYTQLSIRGMTDYHYMDEESNVATIQVEKYQIARQVPGADPMSDIVDSNIVSIH